MREILFRGKIYDGEWIEGAYYHETEFYGDDCDYHYIIRTKDVLEDNMMSYDEVIPETVGQYTGLKDKNGTKIFEGDFIKHFNHFDKPDEYAIYKVEFDERTCKFSGRLHKQWSAQLNKDLEKRYEVIGNIHDNPELLKGGVEK